MQTLPVRLPQTLSLSRVFWHFIKPQWGLFCILALGMVGWAIQESAYPYFIKLIIDKLTEHAANKANIFMNMGSLLLMWAGLWILIDLGFRVYDFISARVFPRFQADIRTALFNYTLEHSYQYFSNHLAGSISSKISRMTDAMNNILTLCLTIMLPIFIAFFISFVILFQAKPIFAYILLGWFFTHLSIAIYFTRRCAELSSIHSRALNTLNGKIVDIFSNITTVRLFARNTFERRYYSGFQNDEIQKAYNLFHYNAIMKLCLGTASLTCVFTMIALGIYAWRENYITIGELALVLTSLNLMGLAWYMTMHLIKVYEDVGTCEEALSLIREVHGVKDVQNAKSLIISRGEIKFDHVTFHYTPKRNLFKEKTVTIHAGEKIGLVGYSGSGKTTFVNLILRHFDVEKGRILIDNQDIKEITQHSLRNQIALIPQDVSLFHRTLMENIRYGKADASDAEVIEAAKAAHCHEFIQLMDQGYDTLVGERGIKLSGGQRQRIAIARAILKNAPILILDEATSALDSITESYIHESLASLMQNRTTIVIAHRLSTLIGMDRILVFKEGQIIEDGNHEALLAANGYYAELWNMQAYGFLPENEHEETAA